MERREEEARLEEEGLSGKDHQTSKSIKIEEEERKQKEGKQERSGGAQMNNNGGELWPLQDGVGRLATKNQIQKNWKECVF